MTAEDVLLTRLHNQLLVMAPGASPETVVRRLGAVQAQDFHGARWGVVQRTDADDGASFDEAFADGRILRTHVLRPTWHFVSPGDIRWMLSLSADRVVAAGRYYRERLGITEGMLDRGMTTIARELEDNGPKTRAEIDGLLDGAGLDSSGGRNAHYLLQAEAQALICSGPPRGRQQTYALLRDRAPAGAVLSRDDACARLAERFFQSHGPAALRDFAW
ncbi:MAG TPA: winged helix DNA-binding domain-containing protein, partial [Spirochaetia bacterium]|nr:winged helix DNA-binding domain-containing protein [Spirochaetia bacterium]